MPARVKLWRTAASVSSIVWSRMSPVILKDSNISAAEAFETSTTTFTKSGLMKLYKKVE